MAIDVWQWMCGDGCVEMSMKRWICCDETMYEDGR